MRGTAFCVCVYMCSCTILFRMVCGDVCICVCVDVHHVSTTIKVTVLGGCTLINYEGDISTGSQSEREKVVVEKVVCFTTRNELEMKFLHGRIKLFERVI
jgi:hypothetical protein